MVYCNDFQPTNYYSNQEDGYTATAFNNNNTFACIERMTLYNRT